MPKRRIFDDEGHVHFVTFTCYKRRKTLDMETPKRSVLGVLREELKRRDGRCQGFVLMPDHVHAMVWFPVPNQISDFTKQWKQRSSFNIKTFFEKNKTKYAATWDPNDEIWQDHFYDFNIFSQKMLLEKLAYMHANPVRAGLVATTTDWPWSSARFYELGLSVGVPLSMDV